LHRIDVGTALDQQIDQWREHAGLERMNARRGQHQSRVTPTVCVGGGIDERARERSFAAESAITLPR
jgi:hypothetical protein